MTPTEISDALLRIEAKLDDLLRLMTLGDEDEDDDTPALDVSGMPQPARRDPNQPL